MKTRLLHVRLWLQVQGWAVQGERPAQLLMQWGFTAKEQGGGGGGHQWMENN